MSPIHWMSRSGPDLLEHFAELSIYDGHTAILDGGALPSLSNRVFLNWTKNLFLAIFLAAQTLCVVT